MKKPKKIELILGSGGARGIAHIKVIELLQRDGFEIDRVVGCSMGAVVGGVFCAGYMDIYKDWLLTLNRSQLFNLMDFTLTNMGFLKGERVLGKMHEITGDQLIEDLPIPYTAVATDMINKKEVYFHKGDLYAAMRASMSIPGIFTPVLHDGVILVDGGVLNPLPLNLAERKSDTLVVAVSLNGPSGTEVPEIKNPGQDGSPDANVAEHKNWLSRFISQPKEKARQIPRFSLIDLMTHSYEFTQDKLVEMTVRAYPPDIVVQIPTSSCGLFDFHKASKLLEIGEEYYEKAMSDFQNTKA